MQMLKINRVSIPIEKEFCPPP